MSRRGPGGADREVCQLEAKIVAAARRMHDLRTAAMEARRERNSIKCERVLAWDAAWEAHRKDWWSNPAPEGDKPPDPCWKGWGAELDELNRSDGPYYSAEELGEGWCDACQRRWKLHAKVTAANLAWGNAKGALTRLLQRDAAMRGGR